MRFLLVDRITAWQPGLAAEAIKNVSLSDDVFADHFPDEPIFPATLILEGLAQVAGLLVEESLPTGGPPGKALLSVVEKAKFRRPVRPGERLRYRIRLLSVNEAGGKVEAEATADDQPCAEARLVFAIAPIANARLQELQRSVVGIWKRGLGTP